MIKKLRLVNQNLINLYERENKPKKLATQNVIHELLKDDGCFFKISIEEAYKILKCLEFSFDECEKIYLQLIKNI